MFNQVNNINLCDGLNINPIPLEFSQEVTTTKFLLAIQAKINEVITLRNNSVADANDYSDSLYNKLINELQTLENSLKNGNIIPNGSIGFEKITSDFMNKIDNFIVDRLSQITKMVWFGIDDNGYFYSVIPENWSTINFSTNENGNLILEY